MFVPMFLPLLSGGFHKHLLNAHLVVLHSHNLCFSEIISLLLLWRVILLCILTSVESCFLWGLERHHQCPLSLKVSHEVIIICLDLVGGFKGGWRRKAQDQDTMLPGRCSLELGWSQDSPS